MANETEVKWAPLISAQRRQQFTDVTQGFADRLGAKIATSEADHLDLEADCNDCPDDGKLMLVGERIRAYIDSAGRALEDWSAIIACNRCEFRRPTTRLFTVPSRRR